MTEAARKLTVVDKATGRVTRWGLGLELAADKGETAALSTAIIAEQERLFGPGCKPELATKAGERAVIMHVNWMPRDKVARLQQYASPADIYERPVNLFVANFVGEREMNLMEGRS